MQTRLGFLRVIVIASIAILGATSAASADDCVLLGGALNGGECQISAAVTRNGTFNLDETLHILPAGKITTTQVTGITLNIAGDLVIDVPSGATGSNGISGDVIGSSLQGRPIFVFATGDITLHGDGTKGASITSNQSAGSCTGGGAGNISLEAAQTITMEPGSQVLSSGSKSGAPGSPCSAGVITMTSRDALLDGLIESRSARSGVGANQPPGGGPIWIDASCTLDISPTGIVRSIGQDPGADLVHLEGGCTVTVQGLVASTGVGHAIPRNPPNSCSDVLSIGPPRRLPVTRPGKPQNSTACVEIWAGDELVITPTGEVMADLAAGASAVSWIDLFSSGNLSVLGDGVLPYAVHANNVPTNARGGTITVKSKTADVLTTGLALQANATAGGGKGGAVIVEASGDVNFGTASIQARGANGGAAAGGTISARAFNGVVSGAAPGELNAGGGPTLGSVTLQGCGTAAPGDGVNYTGTITPASAPSADACGGEPELPEYVVLPECVCDTQLLCVFCELDANGDPVELVVDENVTVNFNVNPPTCDDGATNDLCDYFAFDKSGATPDTWKAIFDVGGLKVVIKSGVTVTTTVVPTSGTARYAPGIQIDSTCELLVEQGGAIVVTSVNRPAGDIVLNIFGNVEINGKVSNTVLGTLGLPGDVIINTCCGDIDTGPRSVIETVGVDPGGSDIVIATCCADADITLNGLVRAQAKAHTGGPRPNITVYSAFGSVTINANTAEPLFDEFNIGGTLFDLFPGLLSLVTSSNSPGTVRVQAAGDVTVNGHGNDVTGPVRTSFGAIAAGTLTSNSKGGTVDVRSIGGAIFGRDRAFEVFGRDNSAALIRLWAEGHIDLSRAGGISANPVVDAGGVTFGGTNDIRSFSDAITVNAGALVLATPAPGSNQLVSCTGVTNNGTVNPADTNAGNDSGVCDPAAPPPLFDSCADLGIFVQP